MIPTASPSCVENETIFVCVNSPCKIRDEETCYDDGEVTVLNQTSAELACGSETVMLENDTICICETAPLLELNVTVLDAITDDPLEGIRITGSGSDATTDTQGQGTLTFSQGVVEAIISAVDNTNTYIDTLKLVDLSITRSVTIYMYKNVFQIQINSNVSTTISVSNNASDLNSSILLDIPEGSFYNASGDLYTGIVNIYLTFIEPSINITDRAPGVFRAVNESTGEVEELQTAGVFTILAEDEFGNRLSASGLLIRVQFSFSLFVLQPNGIWRIVTRQRRPSTGGFVIIGRIRISIVRIRWYNIDKFPENTRCWFKSYFYDKRTGQRIAQAKPWVTYFGYTIAFTNEPAVFPRFMRANNPDNLCIEVRCDNPLTAEKPIGYIFWNVRYPRKQFFIVVRTDPFGLLQYGAAVQASLNNLNFQKLLADPSIRIDLTAQPNGPFFPNLGACLKAGENGNVLKFEVNIP